MAVVRTQAIQQTFDGLGTVITVPGFTFGGPGTQQVVMVGYRATVSGETLTVAAGADSFSQQALSIEGGAALPFVRSAIFTLVSGAARTTDIVITFSGIAQSAKVYVVELTGWTPSKPVVTALAMATNNSSNQTTVLTIGGPDNYVLHMGARLGSTALAWAPCSPLLEIFDSAASDTLAVGGCLNEATSPSGTNGFQSVPISAGKIAIAAIAFQAAAFWGNTQRLHNYVMSTGNH